VTITPPVRRVGVPGSRGREKTLAFGRGFARLRFVFSRTPLLLLAGEAP
jgi:hypothetical protein